MNQITINEALIMFAEIFETDANALKLDSRRDEICGWDSLGVLSIMAEYDSRFGITIAADKLGNLQTIDDLIAILKNSGAIRE